MQGARDEFLAGAGFAEDTDSGFAGGNAFDLRHDATHGIACPYKFVLTETALEIKVLALEASELEGVFDGEQKLVGGDRFFEKIERAEAGGAYGHLDVGLARHHDDGVATPCVLSSSSNVRPSLPGMTTSERMRSKGWVMASSRALVALSQTVASWPSRRKARESEASVLASSSTMSRCAFCGTVVDLVILSANQIYRRDAEYAEKSHVRLVSAPSTSRRWKFSGQATLLLLPCGGL